MIIKETPWETRNLGVESSVEYYYELHDTDVSDKVTRSEFTYQVAHGPVGRVDIVNSLLQNGFRFSETKIELTAELKNLTLPHTFQRFSEDLTYHRANTSELDTIFVKMREGIFDTDKVALDPYFNVQVAGKRYVLWTQDELDAARAFAHVVMVKEKAVGFFILKKASDRLGDSFLAGLFDKEKYGGFGFSVIYFPMVEARRMGLKKMITGVSSNNPDSVKMHLALGYQIKNMDYTLVRHI